MNQSVLAIDDSLDIHRLLRVRLRNEGLDVHDAVNGTDGVAKARALLPDLILLDVDMPGMSGFDVCRALKADAATRNIPVIFLTGAVNVFNKVEGFELGAVDYITKPFDHAELRARVRSALRTKRYQDLLSTRACIDALTGLWNRGYFDVRLGEELSRSLREPSSLSLLLVDIDHFKRINDEFGHPFGDRVISAVGEVLSGVVRAEDSVCRYGGEEFGLILPGATLDGAMAVGARIQEKLAAHPFSANGRPVTVTVSIGAGTSSTLSTESSVYRDVSSLLAHVDEALYAAKRGGRNRVCRAAA